jgi:hypothetical protein
MNMTYIRRRARACQRQAGRCFYCQCLMWYGIDLDSFCAKHDLAAEQAMQLRLTAEHVIARCDNGSDDASNIVAACLYCNMKRHASKQAKTSRNYARYVRAQIRLNQWHLFDPRRHGLLPEEEMRLPNTT